MAVKSQLALFVRAADHGDRLAIVDEQGSWSYGDLIAASIAVAEKLLAGADDLAGARVAYLVPPSFAWVAVTWGIWRAGGVAVPLALAQPSPELAYVLADAEATIAIAAVERAAVLAPLAAASGLRFFASEDLVPSIPISREAASPNNVTHGAAITLQDPAMLLYTSGTTGRPKGVVLSHGNIEAQVRCLVDAWAWSAADRILEVLPLHHVHGIINVVTCSLWSGAVCEMMPRFAADEVWRRLLSGRLTLFMAVPTIYVRLIRAFAELPAAEQTAASRSASALRLMVSGSAALPVPVLERWRELTGHVLLERYGMTEIGMALSNPLVGSRLAGTVGRPLPSVELRLVDELGQPVADGEPGQIEVRGPNVFSGYWRRPEATREAFRDGWFQTGDVAVRDRSGVYRLLGRQSVDIIKSGGEKISALEVEAVLREHPAIRDCAVVGVADAEWGERVAAAAELESTVELSLEELRDWARRRLAVYKVPTLFLAVGELPRNALGKVTKPRVVELLREAIGDAGPAAKKQGEPI